MEDKIKIMLIDDDSQLSEVLVDSLKTEFKIFLFNDPVLALAQMDEINPSLLICDIKMPQLTGYELVQLLRDRGDERHVVIMTGQGGIQNLVSCLKLRIFDYLEKPFTIEKLKSVIERSIQVKKLASNRDSSSVLLHFTNEEIAELHLQVSQLNLSLEALLKKRIFSHKF